MAKNIIIFKESSDESNTLFGFKIVDSKLSEKYIDIINKLSNRNIEFDFGYGTSLYDIEKFEIIKITSSDIKFLEKIFDLEIDNIDSNSIGIFPDVFNDAYEFGIINDEIDDDEEMF